MPDRIVGVTFEGSRRVVEGCTTVARFFADHYGQVPGDVLATP